MTPPTRLESPRPMPGALPPSPPPPPQPIVVPAAPVEPQNDLMCFDPQMSRAPVVARTGPPPPAPGAGGVRPSGAPPRITQTGPPPRTPVDPATLPNAATATAPANQDTTDGLFPGSVRNDSNERIYVLV